MTTETWKPVNLQDYSEFYEVSTFGNVRNIKTKKLLKQLIRTEYYCVSLSYVKENSCNVRVNRLVAKTFIENPNNYEVVNHIDGNKLNNNVSNLEWCSSKMNRKHAVENNLVNFHTRKVQQLGMDGTLIATYDSIKEAEEKTGCSNKNISTVCKGGRKSCGGYIWKYTEDDEDEIIDINQIDGKVIPEYPNYIVTKEGKIYSLNKKGYIKTKERGGYVVVTLKKNNINNHESIHVLVAKLFIPNPENKPYVHHINRDKTDNRVENLCWITLSESVREYNDKIAKAVCQYDLDGNFIKEFVSAVDAGKQLGIESSGIRKTCKGKQKHAGGFVWKLKENSI